MKTEKTEESSKDFAPYDKWLGIPPKSQRPSRYCLLALGQFVNSQHAIHAIDAASDRQVEFLQEARQPMASKLDDSPTKRLRIQQSPLVWMILTTAFLLFGIAMPTLLSNSRFSRNHSSFVLQKDTGPQETRSTSHNSIHENRVDSDKQNDSGNPGQNTTSEPESQSVPGGIPRNDGEQTIGPMIGHVGPTFVNILFRPDNVPCQLKLTLIDKEGKIAGSDTITTTSNDDFVAKFRVDGLQADKVYRYRIEQLNEDGTELLVGKLDEHYFQTASHSRSKKKVTLSFVSCVDNKPNNIWPEMERLDVDMLCLMGDTPYIDTSKLDVVRAKHRSFLQTRDVASVIRHISTVGTWDDHDFGLNNGNGSTMMQGKTKTRQGFVEYRAHEKYGTGTEGVYHKVDRGMIEVFMLDPRYFSQTEASPVDPNQTTCFGQSQWNWLLNSLKASQAPFKVLAMGAIWQDKKNSETDDMFTYWYERDALLKFIADNQISGVVLLGGDIHVARHLIHPHRVGYDLHDFIISPGHHRVIESLNVYHPSLEWSLAKPRQFLTLTADGTGDEPVLIAKYRQAGKVNREVRVALSELQPNFGKGISKGLRAYWPFDKDLANHSRLGDRLDAKPTGGATLANSGIVGGAVEFDRSKKQFLNVGRSVLSDNAAAWTVSMWVKPNSLPSHGTKERQFLLESTASGKPAAKAAYNISIGLRSNSNKDQIDLQLYTHTLKPATKTGAAPTAIAQGGYSNPIDRSLFDKWAHIVVTFDSKKLTLFVNGKKMGQHDLVTPGPSSENGGLIVGGHREGTGRNFDGKIDELAIWARVIEKSEVQSLYNQGQPVSLNQ